MLALTRKIGERIIVGDNIIFTVVDIKGDSVRLAIEAPKEIKIYRGEIYEAIIAENKQSASPVHLNNMDILKDIRTLK
ncbi:carbon storage regulator CsrA [Sporomusa sp.]|uniref:carbon storage regulator CsrA n=1 Tax=Sporomusa sp. TaxID=2078658 RepID=UPI002CB2346B|nr:carbon storage regulator CsrA [Sporomusa sp.]HWR45785.1 carbon storage regulator CsrA [Sporomusa sp.]